MGTLLQAATAQGRRKLTAVTLTLASLVATCLGGSVLLLWVPEPAYAHLVTLVLATQASTVAALGAMVGANALEHRAAAKRGGVAETLPRS